MVSRALGKKLRILEHDAVAITILIAITAAILAGSWAVFHAIRAAPPEVGPLGSTHEHIDIKVYVNGVAVNFSQERYQEKNPYAHFENGDGDILHWHATNVRLGFAFKTLNINLSDQCITIEGRPLCNLADKTLKMFVKQIGGDWQRSTLFDNYVLRDLEKVLISYGNEDARALGAQLNSITNRACLESRKKCPTI